ncbi:Uncharacterised protein [Escherichia coli]|uniref:Uncharacterized protein n=1 Tax=Escherichia coli TaxID=562 RepID=A0A377B733_ECOLX|nr:Uncharacterised protein [Escherichia coli]
MAALSFLLDGASCFPTGGVKIAPATPGTTLAGETDAVLVVLVIAVADPSVLIPIVVFKPVWDDVFDLINNAFQSGEGIHYAVNQTAQKIAAELAKTRRHSTPKPIHHTGKGAIEQLQRRPVEN